MHGPEGIMVQNDKIITQKPKVLLLTFFSVF